MPGLVLIEQAGAPACRVVRLGAEAIAIGRSSQNDLVVADPLVSSRHATARWTRGRVEIASSGKNGTRIDGTPVEAPTFAAWESVVALGASLALVVDDVTPFEERGVGFDVGDDGDDYVIGPRHASALRVARAAGEAGLSLFVHGESGTGKERVARHYHQATGRRGAFQDVDATTVKPELAESQLFGHRRGAFSGADRDQRGKLALAQGGTVFFDELGDMAATVQPRLLRVLQERSVTPVGAESATPIDVRIVSATNRDVRAMIAAGAFREDLFVRLAEVEVELRPLRERREEIPWLVRVALQQVAEGRRASPLGAGADLVEACCLRPWTGENVRGLLRAVKAAALAADLEGASELRARHLPALAGASAARTPAKRARPATAPVESAELLDRLRAAIERHGGSVARAAEELGVPRSTAYWLLKRWGA